MSEPVGRPLKYKTAEEMQAGIDEYFELCQPKYATDADGNVLKDNSGNPITELNPPTITGLALHLGFESRQSMYDYEARGEYKGIISKAREKINIPIKKYKGTFQYEKGKYNACEYIKQRREKDLNFRIMRDARTLFRGYLKGKQIAKGQETFGYSVIELRKHLENHFKKGMNWGNYGEWTIDHKKPVCSFVCESVKDDAFKRCWSLDNLQPLWKEENRKKGAAIAV